MNWRSMVLATTVAKGVAKGVADDILYFSAR